MKIFLFLLALASPALAAGPVVSVALPTAEMALGNVDTAGVIIRATSDKALTALSIAFDTDIGTVLAGTPIAVKPLPGGGLTEVPLPLATNLWGATMTVTVSDKGGRTTTLTYEYSSVNVQ